MGVPSNAFIKMHAEIFKCINTFYLICCNIFVANMTTFVLPTLIFKSFFQYICLYILKNSVGSPY